MGRYFAEEDPKKPRIVACKSTLRTDVDDRQHAKRLHLLNNPLPTGYTAHPAHPPRHVPLGRQDAEGVKCNNITAYYICDKSRVG